MQNDPSSIRGYRPNGQTTREQPCYTGPQQTEPSTFSQRMKDLWQQLDPASVFLLGVALPMRCISPSASGGISRCWRI